MYRHLARQGPEGLITIDGKVKLFPCKKLSVQLSTGAPNHDRATVEQLFASTHAELRHRMAEHSPIRLADELANAILLVALYLATNGVQRVEALKFDIKTLIRIVALELAVVSITEYGWHEENESGEKVRMRSFQCLVGSRVNHSCKRNAEWGYSHELGRFQIKTIRQVALIANVPSIDH